MIRKILVYTYGDQSHESAIRAAAIFALKFDAELTGLFVKPDVRAYSAVYGDFPLNLAQTFYDLQADYANKSRKQFEEVTSSLKCKTRWYETKHEKQPKSSLYTDFIFVSQPDTNNSIIFNGTDFIDHLVTATGLPTIIIPKGWSSSNFGKQVTLGWNETREAVGAVRHSLSLMQASKNVDIVTITKHTDPTDELIKGIEISEYLSEHEINCQYCAIKMLETDHNESEALLRHVEEHNCDLVIIGGYSHPRIREIVMGGMTRTLIKTCPVPLLMSH